MQGTTTTETIGRSPDGYTVFDRLQGAAFEALGILPEIDYDAWMTAAEQAWIRVAGTR
jgi:hypothetical protein